MCKVDSLCYCLFAVGGGPLHPPIPLDGVLALSIFLLQCSTVHVLQYNQYSTLVTVQSVQYSIVQYRTVLCNV